jgi:acyl carrier protein
MDQIAAATKAYILQNWLPDENPDRVTLDTPLMTSGILDSLATLELVSFLEKEYGIEFEAKDVDASRFGTLRGIAAVVAAKVAARGK